MLNQQPLRIASCQRVVSVGHVAVCLVVEQHDVEVFGVGEPAEFVEERLLKDLQPQPERIRDVRQGPDGAICALTDNTAGRILKLVPKR